MTKRKVQATVKDEQLIRIRRKEMIKGAVALFKKKGFHRTTTREIAKAAGFSIGTLYEYIRCKEDILYLVCDSIYDEVQQKLQQALITNQGTLTSLKVGIANYFRVIDELQDEVLVMYQEVKSLTKDALPYVLQKEMAMVMMFRTALQRCVDNGEIVLNDQEIDMLAHNIIVQGQMWSFRRWILQKEYTLEQYINLQTKYLLSGLKRHRK